MATRQEFDSAVDSYLESSHLDFSSEWLSALSKSAAISMAYADVQARFPACPAIEEIVIGSALMKAVAEQAIYLVSNWDSIKNGQITMSESVDGISGNYANIGSSPAFSFRAEQFLKQAKREFFGNSTRIIRG